MAFITALLLAYEPAKRLARMRVQIESGMIGVRMMFEVLDAPLTLTEKKKQSHFLRQVAMSNSRMSASSTFPANRFSGM